jgi:hypothetical protein
MIASRLHPKEIDAGVDFHHKIYYFMSMNYTTSFSDRETDCEGPEILIE